MGSAEAAYDQAAARIEEAGRAGMITDDAELGLAQAKTSLIQAQAAVHTTKLTVVANLASDARAKAEDALAMAPQRSTRACSGARRWSSCSASSS